MFIHVMLIIRDWNVNYNLIIITVVSQMKHQLCTAVLFQSKLVCQVLVGFWQFHTKVLEVFSLSICCLLSCNTWHCNIYNTYYVAHTKGFINCKSACNNLSCVLSLIPGWQENTCKIMFLTRNLVFWRSCYVFFQP